MAFLKDTIKGLASKLPQRYYYSLLTMHDVAQSRAWRRMATPISEETFNDKYQMLFVLGCGRSGTTIFSHCLGKHPNIAALNEPLHIWFATSSATDILSPFASFSKGLCRLDRSHVDEPVRARYRTMVNHQMNKLEPAPIVCDKLPLNTFRVDYITAICPNAKFILLQRSPRDVASSIEQCMKRDGTWWGFNDYKWKAICHYAESNPDLGHLTSLATNDYYRGLIEWRVSQHLAKSDLAKLDPNQHITIDYERFVADPNGMIEKAFDFAGLEPNQEAADYAVAHVSPAKAGDHGPKQSAKDDMLHMKILGNDIDDELSAVA